MPVTVIVNSLTTVHQGSNGMARRGDHRDGRRQPHRDQRLHVRGQHRRRGRQRAGVVVVSHLVKGPAKFVNYSLDAKFDGKNVCRLTDPMTMNGNAPNALSPAEVQAIQQALTDMIGQEDLAMLCKAFCRCNKGWTPTGSSSRSRLSHRG
jgi:hypothetical protein